MPNYVFLSDACKQMGSMVHRELAGAVVEIKL